TKIESIRPCKTPNVSYQEQVFDSLHAHCLQRGELYCDDIFPASLCSLGSAQGSPINAWPDRFIDFHIFSKEISLNPLFISENATRTDIMQGALGDCWLLSSLGCLTLKKKLIHKVLCIPQSFTKDYAGIFHFQFWWQGSWTDVVVDDRLPVQNGHLVFLHSGERNEFWSALLEKAYAKLHGSYEALHGGIPTDAMVDLTGGVCNTISLEKPPDNLRKMMKQALKQAALVTVHIQVGGRYRWCNGERASALSLGVFQNVKDFQHFFLALLLCKQHTTTPPPLNVFPPFPPFFTRVGRMMAFLHTDRSIACKPKHSISSLTVSIHVILAFFLGPQILFLSLQVYLLQNFIAHDHTNQVFSSLVLPH
uniref:Calpain catalytic domain-containing protein n=1 Tax=Eptatretus burgeri TaxID=7764 RepID=A0A8C4QKG7_EPTBU